MLRCVTFRSPIMIFLRFNGLLFPLSPFYRYFYVVLGGSFLAYLCIMTAQRLLRPTVVSMYNYMQPIVATIAAIAMGIGSFGWEKGIAIALVFLGVYIVTQSKSRADLEKAEKSH